MGLSSLGIDLKHPETQKPAQAHEAMPEVFAQWQQIESPWDKERLIFETIYEIIGQYMKPWQTANLLNVMRQPFDAFELLQENISNDLEPEDDIQTCASLGKTLINLNYSQDALNLKSAVISHNK